MDPYPASSAVAQPAAAALAEGEAPAEQPEPICGKRCFVNNLAWRTSWQDLKDHFRRSGTVVFANVIRDQAGRSKGWGIVEFTTPAEAAQAVQEMNGSELDGRFIMVREDREDRDAQRGRGKGPSAPVESSGLQVVVHGIPWAYDDDKLRDIFSASTLNISNAEVVYGKDSKSRGYGTVRFSSTEEAQKAIAEYNGIEVEGRSLSLKIDQRG